MVADCIQIKVINVRREEECNHAGVEDPLDLVFVVSHVALVDVVEIGTVSVDDEFNAHAAMPPGASEVYGQNHLIRDNLVSAADSWPLGCAI